MLKQRKFAVRWKSLNIPAPHWKSLNIPAPAVAGAVAVTVSVVGLAIALPASMASTYRTAGSVPAQSDRAKQPVSGGRPAASDTPRCLVQYTSTSWPGQFKAQVTISNKTKASIRGWTLTFRFPGDQAISGAWNATFTQTGAEVSARGLNFDTTIRQGASQSLGFLGTWRSNHTAPASFRVNGMVCG